MRLYSWNVNGLRACVNKDCFYEFIKAEDPDILCLQETKLSAGQIAMDLPEYHEYWNYAEKKGYSGTAVFTKEEPLAVTYGIGVDEHDHEGRVITLEFPGWYLVNVYVPNSQDELKRLDYRMRFEDDFRAYIRALDAKKPVIYCGDLNVAHEEIDLKNPKTNHFNAGFSDEERAKMTEMLASGMVDSFRLLYPDVTGAYSWWSYRRNARATNAGWRIDYFLVSEQLKEKIREARILSDVYGSDHCPISLEIDLD